MWSTARPSPATTGTTSGSTSSTPPPVAGASAAPPTPATTSSPRSPPEQRPTSTEAPTTRPLLGTYDSGYRVPCPQKRGSTLGQQGVEPLVALADAILHAAGDERVAALEALDQ